MGPKKFFIPKDFGSKKILGPKKFWVQKNFGPKKFWSKKILGPKNFWIQTNFRSSRILSKKRNLVQKKNWGKKKLGSQKIFVSKKTFGKHFLCVIIGFLVCYSRFWWNSSCSCSSCDNYHSDPLNSAKSPRVVYVSNSAF